MQIRSQLIITAALLALIPPIGLASVERTHEITLDDYLSVYLLTDCDTSPDGKFVAYAELRWGDHDKPRTTDIWIVDTTTRQPLRLTFDPVSDHSPKWGPRGQHLYFVTKRDRGDERPPYDGSNQVWALGTHPSEPLPITRVEDGIQDYQLSDDGRTLYYTKTGEEAKQDWKKLRKEYSDIDFGYGKVEYTEVWKLDLQTWREEKVVAPERVILEFHVSPDQSRVAMLTAPDDRLVTREGHSRIDVYEVASGDTVTLPDKLYRADAPSPHGWLGSLAWASDSRKLAFTVDFDGYPGEILVAELGDGEPTVFKLQRENQMHCSGNLQWQPDTDNLCFLAEDNARRRVYCITDIASGNQGSTHALTPGDVVIHDYSFTADGKQFSFIKSDTESCRDVFWSATAQPDTAATRLTTANPQMETWLLPEITHITWTAPDGAEVGGILELPPGYTPDQGPLPLVVELHGGPTAATLLHMRYWIYGRTIMAAKGYALLSPNYRGSTGYGDQFLAQLIGRENDIEVQDILAGVDALIDRGIADPQRMGVMGWSNGGFLTNALITTTQRFKAASSGAGVLDQFMQWGLEDTPGHVINYMRGQPWQQTEAYIKASPAYKLGSVTTPTIIHVGAEDPRVPTAHSRSLYRALKQYSDVPTVLLVYPGAGHGLVISDHRKGKLAWDIAWFDKYVLGNEEEQE